MEAGPSSFSSLSSPDNYQLSSLVSSRRIDLDENTFIDHEKRRLLLRGGYHDLAANVKRDGRAAFLSYARWLEANYHEQVVDAFRLCLSNPQEFKDDVERWVKLATGRFAEEIELDFSNHDTHSLYPRGYMAYCTLPDDIYHMHVTLKSLKLCGCRVEADKFGVLRRLRRLVLQRVDLRNEDVQLLINRTPNLEEVWLRRISWMDGFEVRDLRERLHWLAIEECLPMITRVKVVAPGLRCFKYSGFATELVLENLDSIEEAELDVNQQFKFGAEGDHLSDAIISLGNAKTLRLCSSVTQVIATGYKKLQLPVPVDKLKHLVLKRTRFDAEEIEGFVFLLRSFPNLEALTIEIGPKIELSKRLIPKDEMDYTPSVDPLMYWEAQLLSPIACLDHSLRTVEINNFTGEDSVISFLKYILKRSESLQELIVSSKTSMALEWGNLMTYASLAQQLMHGERASPNVKIDFR